MQRLSELWARGIARRGGSDGVFPRDISLMPRPEAAK